MAARREEDAAVYLEKHKLIELMDNLTSMLFFYRPEKPREFLIEKLEQLKLSQQSGVIGPNLFDDSNLDVVFRIMDPDNKQYITFVQYKQGDTVALQPKDTGFKSSLGPFCDEFERPPLIVSLHRPQNYVANVFILYIAKCYCNNNNHSSPQL
uniref:Si:dkey-42p14.3 n=1 Tax=Neolamprologus brichardi TaxID=32507 RepID=A0A3Q4MW13_NEOBR